MDINFVNMLQHSKSSLLVRLMCSVIIRGTGQENHTHATIFVYMYIQY